MPLMKYLWNDAKITTEGMIARIAPVYISCHSEVSRPTMRLIVTLMVPADEESRRTRGTKKSFQRFNAWMITNALVTGMSIGKTISQNVRSRPARSEERRVGKEWRAWGWATY